jgi:hypothetical protein
VSDPLPLDRETGIALGRLLPPAARSVESIGSDLADAMRAQAALGSAAQQPVTTTVLRKLAATARKRMRIEGGGYRRDHLRALAQRVEVADGEVRIMGSKGDLLRTLAAASGVKSATPGVRSSVLNWRKGCPPTIFDFAGYFLSFLSLPTRSPTSTGQIQS